MAVHRLNKSRGPSSNINDIHLFSNHKTMPQYLHLHLHHLHLYLHHHNNRDRSRVEEIKAISTREVLKQLHCGNFRNSPLEDKYTCDNFQNPSIAHRTSLNILFDKNLYACLMPYLGVHKILFGQVQWVFGKSHRMSGVFFDLFQMKLA